MLPEVEINYLALLAATVANMVFGFVWYLPAVFGNTWMKLLGKKKEDVQPTAAPFVIMFVLAMFVAYVLSHFLAYTGADTTGEAITTAIWLALGLVLAPTAANNAFAGKPWKLWAIDYFYQSLGLVLMAIVISLF